MTAHSAWLAVIDMQSAFGDPTSEWSAEGYAEIVPTVDNLVAEFGDRVVFTRLVRDPTEPGYWPAYYDRWPPFRLSQDDPVWDLTVDVPEGAHVIDEPTFSKWAGRSRGSSVTPRW